MDLTRSLLRAVAARPHVLPAVPPGATAARLAMERELRLRDLPQALTPADADILLEIGAPGPDLRSAIERLWQDMVAPRARVRAVTAGEVPDALGTACAQLADAVRQRDHAATLAAEPEHEHGTEHEPEHESGESGEDEPGDDSGAGGHEDPTDHDDHDNHGHHGGMSMPGGLPMAEVGPDRDGLALDRLHVPLGPLLADWPAGLTLRTVLQGDVVQWAEARLSAPPPAPPVPAPVTGPGSAPGRGRGADGAPPGPPFWTSPWRRAAAGEPVSTGEAARRRAAAHLDSLGRLLSVAGWPDAAVTARRLRDELLDGVGSAEVRARAERFARRVGQSRTLARMTRGIGPLSAAEAAGAGVSGPAARADGDTADRYRCWLDGVRDDLARLPDTDPLDPSGPLEGPRGRLDAELPPSAALVAVLPGLLAGAELAAARLIVASLDPDPDELPVRPPSAKPPVPGPGAASPGVPGG